MRIKDKYVKEGYIIFVSLENVCWYAKHNGRHKKRGRPIFYSEEFIEACAYMKFYPNLSYRALEGLLRFIAKRLKYRRVISYTQIFRRIIKKYSKLKASIKFHKSDNSRPLSSGISITNRGSYIEQIYGRTRRRFIKIKFGVDEEGNLLCHDVSDEKTSEVDFGYKVIERFKPRQFIADGSYDAHKIYIICEKTKTLAYIPVRRNAKLKGFKSKRRRLLARSWRSPTIRARYKKRTIVERAFSAFKRRFGDMSRAKKYHIENILACVDTFMFLQNL